MILLYIALHSLDDRVYPLNNESLQPIFLIKVSVHELLQSLPSKFIIRTFLVKLDLLCIHIYYQISQLLLS